MIITMTRLICLTKNYRILGQPGSEFVGESPNKIIDRERQRGNSTSEGESPTVHEEPGRQRWQVEEEQDCIGPEHYNSNSLKMSKMTIGVCF